MMGMLATLHSIPPELSGEMFRLHGAGFTLIPLGGDGKSPLCAFTERKPTLTQTLGLMRARQSLAYGVLLDGVMVVDADEMNGEIEDEIDARFGPASVKTATPRGRHHFYRDPGSAPNLRAEGLLIDIKRGPHSYVVGPGSVRPDGGEYTGIHGRLGVSVLTPPKVRPKGKAQVQRGERHGYLVKRARAYVELVDSCAELTANLMHDRDANCERGGEPMSDTEVVNIAEWAWAKRLEPGGLYEGRNSRFKVSRDAMDHLLPQSGGAEAFALHSVLVANHGHIPGKRFALDFAGMKNAGLIGFGRPRFRAARDQLLDCGLIRKVGGFVPGRQSQHFQLGMLQTSANQGFPYPPHPPGERASSYIGEQDSAPLPADPESGAE